MIVPKALFYDSFLSSGSPRLFPRIGGGHEGGGGGGRGSSEGGSGKSSSSSSSKGESSDSFNVPSSGKGTLSASPSSRGGGTPVVIPSGHAFSGRLSGGATRDQVYGNSRIGSGYPYGAYGSYYGGRPFPYGFYPVYISPGYYGGDEYSPSPNDTRPGGPLSTAVILPSPSSGNTSSLDSYYLIGDHSSVSLVLASLVSKCGIANSTVIDTYINGTSSFNETALVPHPEQVVQYYRASSFALALSTHNNTAALPSHAPASNDSAAPPLSDDTPLPVGLNVTLLACLNSTIANVVPLLDTGSNGGQGLTSVQIAWLTAASLAAILIVVLIHLCCNWRCTRPKAR